VNVAGPQAGWELTEHTADVGIHAWGSSAASAFQQAALAMLSLITDVSAVEPAEERVIEVESPELDLLLAAFLNDLLYLIESGRFVPAAVHVEEPARRPVAAGAAAQAMWHMRAQVRGEPFDPARHHVRTVVKAATLHGLSLGKADGRWEATVILDV
jgi:SHS2 domain-containing protein